MKKSLYITVLFVLLSIFSHGQIVLVIDAGHGGKDPGNLKQHAERMNEKDINIKIANYLGGYIEKYLSGVKIIYTRTSDQFISLERRVEIANTYNADYFISIHANSNPDRSIYGTRIHIFDKKNSDAYGLAKQIDKEFTTRAARHSRGIMDTHDRGYNLYVLEHTSMPALLIETGFMSNHKEEYYLNTQYGQEIIASAIYRAFRDYTNLKKRTRPSREARKKAIKIAYMVQIRASTEAIPQARFAALTRAGFQVDQNYYAHDFFKYKYTVGKNLSYAKAEQIRKKVASLGFEDAFIIKNKR